MLQIRNLRRRLVLLHNRQAVGTASMFGCMLTMFVVFTGLQWLGQLLFGFSLLGLALREIQISVEAPNIELGSMQQGRSTTGE